MNILCMAVLLLAVSCGNEGSKRAKALEMRADAAIVPAIEQAVKSRYGQDEPHSIRDLKLVYSNDSICLKQCYVDVVQTNGKKEMLEYRFIYLVDMYVSRVRGEAVYSQALLDFPCMSDQAIKNSRNEILATGESVYDSMYGMTANVVPEN